MYRYAIIDENGIVVGVSQLSGEVSKSDMILIDSDFDLANKKWNGSVWETYEPPEPEPPEPTQLDNIEEAQLMIMEAMADQYEQRLETDLMMMDAQATTFEAVLSLSEGGVSL